MRRSSYMVYFNEAQEAMYEDLGAISQILGIPVSTLIRTILQFHLERDKTLRNRTHFEKVYEFPHEYKGGKT